MFEELLPLTPCHFFNLQVDCYHAKDDKLSKKHLLPDLSLFQGERPFAQVFLGYQKEGIRAEVEIEGSFDQSFFPHFQTGDSIEFFFDTRDVKTSGHTTRFCHHFYFLPVPPSDASGDSLLSAEITRFRTEDAHPLCDPSKIQVESKIGIKRTVVKIFIPSESLFGYDPEQFNRIGFTYRINRVRGKPQFFSANARDFTIEQQPSLWASLQLRLKS